MGADLVAVTGENQTLHSQLSQTSADRDQLQEEMGECERYIANLEDSINVKDMERENLMGSYRKLITEYEKIDVAGRGAADEVNGLRMEVIMRDKRVTQLNKEVEETGREAGALKVDLKGYERQYGNVTRSLATAERAIEHLEKEKVRMGRDLGSMKDLLSKIEGGKDGVQRELMQAQARVDDLATEIEKLECVNDDLSNTIKAEVHIHFLII